MLEKWRQQYSQIPISHQVLVHCMSTVKFVLCLVVAAHATINIEDFPVHIDNLLANDKYGFSEEYKVKAVILTTLHFFNNTLNDCI